MAIGTGGPPRGCSVVEMARGTMRRFGRVGQALLALLPCLLRDRHGGPAARELIHRLAGQECGPIRTRGGRLVRAAISPAADRGLEEDLVAGVLLGRVLDDGGLRRAARSDGGAASDAARSHLAVGARATRHALLGGEAVDALQDVFSVLGLPASGMDPRAVVRFRKRVRLALRSAPRWSPPPRSRSTFALTGPRDVYGRTWEGLVRSFLRVLL